MILPQKKLERNLFKAGYQQVIAVDEVGTGALAGPVLVCAVRFDKKFFQKSHRKLHWLRDSKLLSAKKREEFAANLLGETKGFKYRISFCYPKTIDRLNIYQAARLAMRRAINKLEARGKKQETRKIIVLVDGPNKINGLDLDQIPVVKGDRKVFAIACASIIAKVTRDRMMTRYAKRLPDYGFERHKGYGTNQHRSQLAAIGPSKIHRLSFAPVAKLIQN